MYRKLDLSMRYIDYYTGQPGVLGIEYDGTILVEEIKDAPDRGRTIIHTPKGDLTYENHFTIDETWRTVRFPVKDLDDLLVLEYVFDHRQHFLIRENLESGDRFMGDLGVPQFYLPKSPYQELCQHWMKLEDFLFALIDHTEIVERIMSKIDRSYDRLYREVIDSGLVQIANFGENIHAQLLSPAFWQEYLVPFYEKRCRQLRGAGIFSHVHIDGYYLGICPCPATLRLCCFFQISEGTADVPAKSMVY